MLFARLKGLPFDEPQLRQVTRPAASRDEAAEGASGVGQRAQGRAELAAPQSIARKTIDKVEPVEDRRLVGERAGKIVGKQARARRGDSAVDRAEQAAVARSCHRPHKFEAFARRGVDRQTPRGEMPHRRLEEGRRAGADMIKIGDERAHRGNLAARKGAEAVERLDAEEAFETLLRRRAGKFCGGSAHKLACRRYRLLANALADQQLRRRQPRQFGIDRFGPHRNNLEPPGRNIGGGNSDLALAADLGQRGEAVGAAPFEQAFLGQRSGGDKTDDRARNERL